jgi:hypothetical protein
MISVTEMQDEFVMDELDMVAANLSYETFEKMRSALGKTAMFQGVRLFMYRHLQVIAVQKSLHNEAKRTWLKGYFVGAKDIIENK